MKSFFIHVQIYFEETPNNICTWDSLNIKKEQSWRPPTMCFLYVQKNVYTHTHKKNVTHDSNIFIKFISISKFSIYILPNSTPPHNYLRPPIYGILFLYQPLTIISIPLKYIKDQPSNLLYPLESIMFINIF